LFFLVVESERNLLMLEQFENLTIDPQVVSYIAVEGCALGAVVGLWSGKTIQTDEKSAKSLALRMAAPQTACAATKGPATESVADIAALVEKAMAKIRSGIVKIAPVNSAEDASPVRLSVCFKDETIFSRDCDEADVSASCAHGGAVTCNTAHLRKVRTALIGALAFVHENILTYLGDGDAKP
jgi:hypothetical protein